MTREVAEEYGSGAQPFAVLADPVTADTGTVTVRLRAAIEDEVVHIIQVLKPSERPGGPQTLRVLRGQEGTQRTAHPAGAELLLLGRDWQ